MKKMSKSIIYYLYFFLSLSFVSCSEKSQETKVNIPSQLLKSDQDTKEIVEEINALFNAPEEYREGVKSICVDGKYGFQNEFGKIVIQPIYDAVGVFNEGLVTVTINGKDGFINHEGKLVIPAIYDFAHFFSEGRAAVAKNGKYGFIDPKGNVVIDLIYDNVGDFFDPNGFASVKKNGKEGLIDRFGNIIMPIEYEYAGSTQNGVAHIFNKNQEIEVYNDRSYRIITY